jgi:hypothetical protein
MTNESSAPQSTFHWKWVAIGVVMGLIMGCVSYFVIGPVFNNVPIQVLVYLMGFVLTGATVGYFSPGVTMKEATAAGGAVAVLLLALLGLTESPIRIDFVAVVLGVLLGLSMAWMGAWVGEKLQGSEGHPEEETRGMFTDVQGRWVLIGVILGFALNVLAVFLVTPLFGLNLDVALVVFLFGFVVTGFIVGYKSPGVTLKEPALAGLIAVVLEWIFIEFILELAVPGGYLAFGLVLGFFMSLFGAWLGERYQLSLKARAAGSSS